MWDRILAVKQLAIQAVRELCSQPDTDAVLLISISNAFNSLYYYTALQELYQPFSVPLINTYCHSNDLFVDGESILSTEGTTQGEIGMPMYELGILPLITKLDIHAVH